MWTALHYQGGGQLVTIRGEIFAFWATGETVVAAWTAGVDLRSATEALTVEALTDETSVDGVSSVTKIDANCFCPEDPLVDPVSFGVFTVGITRSTDARFVSSATVIHLANRGTVVDGVSSGPVVEISQ
tara:strand:- start:613 stop:999 length:387 start_codon:yes stop_codon:yes gene_type:complete